MIIHLFGALAVIVIYAVGCRAVLLLFKLWTNIYFGYYRRNFDL